MAAERAFITIRGSKTITLWTERDDSQAGTGCFQFRPNFIIVNGTSETTFTPEREMTCEEYLTLILRSLGYTNTTLDNACTMAAEYGLLTIEKLNFISEKIAFLRADMVHITYNSLNVKGVDGKTILDNLLSENLITKSQYNSFSN